MDEPHFVGRGTIKIRGSSTQSRPKKAYAFEIQDERGDDKDVEILGFPGESDYILYAAYNFDRALMRNAFVYEVSNQIGRYAVRTKFFEVFVKAGRGAISRADYRGVYSAPAPTRLSTTVNRSRSAEAPGCGREAGLVRFGPVRFKGTLSPDRRRLRLRKSCTTAQVLSREAPSRGAGSNSSSFRTSATPPSISRNCACPPGQGSRLQTAT